MLREAVKVIRFVWTRPENRKTRLRSLIRAASFQVGGRLLHRPAVVPIGDHSRIIGELHWTASSRAVYVNPPDVEMHVWRRWLSSGDLFVDVGANVGIYTIMAADRGCNVIAIEPDTESVRRLKANLVLNGHDVEVHECALADQPGHMQFTEGLGDCLNHLVLAGDTPTRSVEVTTLDTVLAGRHARGAKIDVEGAENLVFAGSRRALEERRIDLLQIECYEPPTILVDLGYEFLEDDGAGNLVPHAGRSHGRDLFARPKVS